MEHADISMEARVVAEPVVETVVSKPGETEIAFEILSAFEPMDVDMVVDPTIATVEEEVFGFSFVSCIQLHEFADPKNKVYCLMSS
ncbi:hypothetical protein Tco_0824886 [Tanacetum coccineum]